MSILPSWKFLMLKKIMVMSISNWYFVSKYHNIRSGIRDLVREPSTTQSVPLDSHVPLCKIKDTSDLKIIKEATKNSFVENAQNMDSSLIDTSSISFKEGTPLLYYSVPDMQPIFAQKISSCNPCKTVQAVSITEPIIKGKVLIQLGSTQLSSIWSQLIVSFVLTFWLPNGIN